MLIQDTKTDICTNRFGGNNGNSETIVVLQGTADYNDNGTPITLHAGDKVHCPSGESHSIGNPADAKEDLLLQALVIKTN